MVLSPQVKRFLQPAVVLAIALVAFGIAAAISGAGTQRVDDFFYDSFYRLRPQQDMTASDVVLVAVDDQSLQAAKKHWPWPRKYLGDIATYVARAGARVIAFDIIFSEPGEPGDDDAFADQINRIKTPVIFGAEVMDTGDWAPFGPRKIVDPTFGAVNLGKDKVYRRYPLELNGQPSLAEMTAARAVTDLSRLPMIQDHPDVPFLLHYYGPHIRSDGKQTFRFVQAYPVLMAQQQGKDAEKTTTAAGISPALFKDKIVIICAVALGAFDLKVSPLSDEYPGAEVQATAMENLLHSQQVHVVPWGLTLLLAAAGALAVSAGIVFPRRAVIKVLVPVAAALLLLAVGVLLFRGQTIRWMSPVTGLLSILIAAPLAFGWTYFSEDRQRRFMLRALSKVVSPAVAQQLAQDPDRLALGTVRTEITVLFTDLANFTDLAEGMDVQQLGTMINRYLGEMSAQVFAQDGTLDKYIGDAVMCFWNAPLAQNDHAIRACRAALAMIRREKELHGEFTALGIPPTKRIFTRIGINTATVAVGFIGSEHLFNYTAMGDGVNLASRIEGANKIYGTQILLTESTAEQVRAVFHLRKLDVLRVKGKKQPMPVYELIAEKSGQDPALEERIRGYESAFEAYQQQNWDRAEQLLLELSGKFGEDAPGAALLSRVRDYRRHPPPPPWDGVYISSTK